HRLEPVAVLVAADRRREAGPAEREETELQERLALRALLGVRLVDGARPEVADRRRQAGVVGEVAEPGILRDQRQLDVRQHDREAGAQLARDEAVAMSVRGGGSRAWTEPVDELAPQTLAGDERDPIPPVAAVVAAHDRRGEKAEHQHRADGPRHRPRAGTYPRTPADSRPPVIHGPDLRVERQNQAVRG